MHSDATWMFKIFGVYHYWMDPQDQLPHVGDRPTWGFMNKYEWNGEEYEERPDLTVVEPHSWSDELQAAELREMFLELF